jgi:hypothetical protein
MRRMAILVAVGVVVTSCSPGPEAAAPTNKCATSLYPTYNPKALDQCVSVCLKCDHGSQTTCSTSCTMKGAK